MAVEFQERPSDSRLVQAVTRMVYEDVRTDLNIPDGRWDIVIFRNDRRATALVTGATTRPVASSNSPGDEVLCISFKPGVYMPAFSPATMRDRAVTLLNPNHHSMTVGFDAFEIPTFENADDFVAKLAGAGLFAQDELVQSVISGNPLAASTRSIQRHFLQATGLTWNFYRQVARANRAVALLSKGWHAIDVAVEAGYFDQSHMINSLKSLLGRTPSQLTCAPQT